MKLPFPRGVVVLAVGTLGLALGTLACDRTKPQRTTETSKAESAGVPSGGATTSVGSRLVIHCQFFQVVVSRDSNDDVRLTFTEFVPENFAEASIPAAPGTTAGAHTASFGYSVPYLPVRFASRAGDEVYIAGPPLSPEDGSLSAGTVLEMWMITAPEGAPYATRAKRNEPIGTPAPLSALEAHVQGGTYIVAEQRREPRIQKRALGHFPFDVNDMEVDPEGRYVLLVSRSEQKLYRLNLVGFTGIPELVLDSVAAPILIAANSVYVVRYQDQLKRYVVGRPSGANLVLCDADNDGIFESSESFDADAWASSSYAVYRDIEDNYRTYQPVGLFH